MRKKMIRGLLIIAMLLFSVPIYAATRAPKVHPILTFSGTQANCSLTVIGDNMTDEISATIRLKQGTRTLATWTASDTGMLDFSDTVTVFLNQAYTLTSDVQINGAAYAPVSISATNN